MNLNSLLNQKVDEGAIDRENNKELKPSDITVVEKISDFAANEADQCVLAATLNVAVIEADQCEQAATKMYVAEMDDDDMLLLKAVMDYDVVSRLGNNAGECEMKCLSAK